MMEECGRHSSLMGYGQVADTFNHGNESLGSIKCGKFLVQLINY